MKKIFNLRLGKKKFDGKTAAALALLPGAVLILVLHQVFLRANVYLWYFPDLDIVMHIMGGAAVAWAAWVFISYAQNAKKFSKLPFWFAVIFAVGVACMVGVVWEFYEFLHDVIFNTEEQLSQFGLGDTMKDLANDLIGGFILSILVGQKILKK